VDFIGFDKDFDVSLATFIRCFFTCQVDFKKFWATSADIDTTNTTSQGHMMDLDTIPKEVNLYGKQTLKVHFEL
jgi:hypothetical protein